jgi:hypothetical protein
MLRFRTNPNEVWWNYSLITAVENTYGGRVVQILGAKIDDLVVTVECGRGGWDYLNQVVGFMREMIAEQRKGVPGTFSYTTRDWRLKVFALSVPFQDSVTATTREIELRFKVQEDVSGVQTSISLSSELGRLKDGIGFTKNEYNTGNGGTDQQQTPNLLSPTSIPGNVLGMIPGIGSLAGSLPSIPGVPLP